MELKVELNKNELAEVAKMAFIAQYVMSSSGPLSTDYRYPNWEIFQNALRHLNKALLQLIPDYGLLEVDGNNKKAFTHSIKMENEMDPVLNEFSQEGFLNQICKAITDRDYTEEYGGNPGMEVTGDNSVYDILYKSNWKELERNRLKNVRLQY